jgi:hypothetical protein
VPNFTVARSGEYHSVAAQDRCGLFPAIGIGSFVHRPIYSDVACVRDLLSRYHRKVTV